MAQRAVVTEQEFIKEKTRQVAKYVDKQVIFWARIGKIGYLTIEGTLNSLGEGYFYIAGNNSIVDGFHATEVEVSFDPTVGKAKIRENE